MRTPARLSEIQLQSIQRKTSAWASEKHLVLTTNTTRMKFYRMIISLIVVDEEILYGEAMGGDSLTAVAMRAMGQSFHEETSTPQHPEQPPESMFGGEARIYHFEQSKMVSVRNSETSGGLPYFN